MLGALDLACLSLASPIPVPATPVERVLGRLAGKHRPAIAPPVFFAWSHIKMRRKPSPPTIDTFRLLDVLRLDFSTLIIDDDEMKTNRLKEARELLHSRTVRREFRLGDDVVRHASA